MGLGGQGGAQLGAGAELGLLGLRAGFCPPFRSRSWLGFGIPLGLGFGVTQLGVKS